MKAFGVKDVNVAGWIEVEKPTLEGFDAILRPLAIAPCSSDTHALHAEGTLPIGRVLGHEAVAEVVEVAPEVKHFKPGDIVVVPTNTPNWEEPDLQQRDINNAHDSRIMGSFKFVAQKNGVMAEYFHVNNADANLVNLPENVSMKAALMTVDMMSTGFYSIENAEVKFGDNVVVIGIGPVGLMAVAGAKLRGAARIVGIGTRPDCIELAKEYGATDILSYKDGDLVEQVRKLFPKGADAVIVAGGGADSLEQALRMTKANGYVSNVNYFDAKDSFNIPARSWGLGMSDITIRGGFCPGGADRIKRLLRLIEVGRINPEKLLNYEFKGFDKIEDAFKIMDEKPRDLIKPVVLIDWK
ncbi:MAG: zinc-binding dehydrogenase [Tissierellia bacterium]|nr:zinc-binding dehydrogenase [Tissierellia bacterium]